MFSDADREAIRKAVHAAEGKTSGEIVPFVTRRSGRYAAAAWRAATVGVVLGTGIALVVQALVGTWGASWIHDALFVHTVALVLGLGFFAAGRWWAPAVRLFAGRITMDRSAHRRAMEAFVEEEVFNTRDRTGILLFVSLLERRIEVVGDAGINARVTPADWADVVLLVRDGIRSGEAGRGLVAGIERCGTLLREKGVELKKDDQNELSDRLRLDDGD